MDGSKLLKGTKDLSSWHRDKQKKQQDLSWQPHRLQYKREDPERVSSPPGRGGYAYQSLPSSLDVWTMPCHWREQQADRCKGVALLHDIKDIMTLLKKNRLRIPRYPKDRLSFEHYFGEVRRRILTIKTGTNYKKAMIIMIWPAVSMRLLTSPMIERRTVCLYAKFK